MMNVAMADAAITVWPAKYNYNFWRPITAIRLADTDGNPATDPDTGWTPLITTPAYPDYPSGLLGVSSAGVAVLVHFFGANSSFDVPTDSTASGIAGVKRSFSDFSSALDELVGARIRQSHHRQCLPTSIDRRGRTPESHRCASPKYYRTVNF
jgi:hypothetical protein